MFDKMHAARLTKLADHLENAEELGVGSFSFAMYYQADYYDGIHKTCGTAGCAIGECPFIFPGEWELREDKPMLRNLNSSEIYPSEVSGKEFFGLTAAEFHHMFWPGTQDETISPTLYSRSTRTDVANGIRKFLEHKAKELDLP